jgi:hypothetical protein
VGHSCTTSIDEDYANDIIEGVNIARIQGKLGRWIVIECNDAQESGYAGVQPQLLCKQVLERI